MADIGCDRLDLRRGQIMGDRLHDRRGVGIGLVLSRLLLPVGQLSEDVVMQLTGEPWKCVGTFAVRAVT